MFSVVYFAMARTPLCCFAARTLRGGYGAQFTQTRALAAKPARNERRLGGNLELNGRVVAGKRLHEPEVSPDCGARVLHRLHFRRSPREAPGQVEHLRE